MGRYTATHSYAILKVSRAAFDEIRQLLESAGYSDQFDMDEEGDLIDMHGIALQPVDTSGPDVPLYEG